MLDLPRNYCPKWDAGFRLEVMESTAEAIINSKSIGTLSNMPAEVIRDLDRVFLGRN